ncbi:YfbM family protein [Nocardia xishanensis]
MGLVMSFTKVTSEQFNQVLDAGPRADEVLAMIDRSEDDPCGYLDKSWDALRYLLEEASTGVDLFQDGDIVEGQEFSAWSAEVVRSTSERLNETPFDALAAHYHPEAMDDANIYPNIWIRDGDDGLSYLRDYYVVLVKFFDDAAKSNCAALMHFG